MKKELLKRKVHTQWTWVLILLFFALSILNVYFGLLGLICMTFPMYHALRGRGKIHCSHYCPRGAILGKFLPNFTFNNTLPIFMRKKSFKSLLLLVMMLMFTFAIYEAGGALEKIAFAITRLMFSSFIVGIILGVFFKPRAWCQVCPMGTGTGYIRDLMDKSNKNG